MEHHRADAARFCRQARLAHRGRSDGHDEHWPFAAGRDDRQRQLHVRLSHGGRPGRRGGRAGDEPGAVSRAGAADEYLRAVLRERVRDQSARGHPRVRAADYWSGGSQAAQEQPAGCVRLDRDAGGFLRQHGYRFFEDSAHRLRRGAGRGGKGGAARFTCLCWSALPASAGCRWCR